MCTSLFNVHLTIPAIFCLKQVILMYDSGKKYYYKK